MSNTNSSCTWCGKGFNRAKAETAFCFCCDECKDAYNTWLKKHETKHCDKPKTNPAFEQVPK